MCQKTTGVVRKITAKIQFTMFDYVSRLGYQVIAGRQQNSNELFPYILYLSFIIRENSFDGSQTTLEISSVKFNSMGILLCFGCMLSLFVFLSILCKKENKLKTELCAIYFFFIN
jgi:hypothetical protein